MTNLYLIAHKVRGKPAFDIATQMECPECAGHDALYRAMYKHECHECDGLGYWWIVPTSGHRAYPIMHWELNDLCHFIPEHEWQPNILTELGPIEANPAWASLPDHYTTRAEPRIDLKAALGLNRPAQPHLPLPRRRI